MTRTPAHGRQSHRLFTTRRERGGTLIRARHFLRSRVMAHMQCAMRLQLDPEPRCRSSTRDSESAGDSLPWNLCKLHLQVQPDACIQNCVRCDKTR